MKNWYALYTKSGWEKKVVRMLYKKNVENYCPLQLTIPQQGYPKKVVEEPLFKPYVFVYIEDKERPAVKQTEGVINFVYRVDQPVVIKTEEMAAMQDFLGMHKKVLLEKVGFKTLDKISSDASFSNPVLAVSSEQLGNKTILGSLGYALVAEPDTTGAEILAPSAMPIFKKPFYQYGAAIR